ncbi:MAG: hypothetical protein JNM84_21115 [Planctomycetes bacterium]|nr:hypothetical protein [Planctomycetota bacterium]
MKVTIPKQYFFCLSNDGYEASLEVGKVYPVKSDAASAELELLRVIDESGEDYLYPRSWFCPIALPLEAQMALEPRRAQKRAPRRRAR